MMTKCWSRFFAVLILVVGPICAVADDPLDPECPEGMLCVHERSLSGGAVPGSGKMQPYGLPKSQPLAGASCSLQDQNQYECLVQVLRSIDKRLGGSPQANIQLKISQEAKEALSKDEFGQNVILVLERIQKEMQLKNSSRARGLIQGLNKAIEQKSLEKVKQVLQNAKTAKPVPESAISSARSQKVQSPKKQDPQKSSSEEGQVGR